MTDDEPITLAAVVDRCAATQRQKVTEVPPREVTRYFGPTEES